MRRSRVSLLDSINIIASLVVLCIILYVLFYLTTGFGLFPWMGLCSERASFEVREHPIDESYPIKPNGAVSRPVKNGIVLPIESIHHNKEEFYR